MRIIGTAGHVDHGKSSLVRALTGTNPDRWLEEQQRGMTLDLGFAHLELGEDLEAGIVDVPGHERFLHNMLAGAAGMEALLLVVAADEGVRPQTVEHLQILRYLNVRSVIVAVTKADLLSADDLAFALESIREQLRGSIAQDAPVLAVSSTTGAGLPELVVAIREAITALPPRNTRAPAYLPIDRVFALPGRGTIVTGTLMQGAIESGDELKLLPSGKDARVRTLQRFGVSRTRADAGSRVAVNLPGIDTSEIARGEVLAAPQFAAEARFSVTFEALAESLHILRRRNAVRCYIGSAELLGTLVLDDAPTDCALRRGELFLRSQTAAYPGMAYVVRRISPKNLLGGGRIEEPLRSIREQETDAATPLEVQVLALLRVDAAFALTSEGIARAVNAREDAVAGTLERLVERGAVLEVARPRAFAERDRALALLRRAIERMGAHQTSEPWAMGRTSLALARELAIEEHLLLRLLGAFAEEGLIAHRSGYFSTADFTPVLTAEQRAFFDSALGVNRGEGAFLPVPLASLLADLKRSRVPGIGKAFDTLVVKGALVKVNDEIYTSSQIAALRARIERFFSAEKTMTMAQFRDLAGTSRKYAVPLLEWFDAQGVTVRSGDYRMLRRGGKGAA